MLSRREALAILECHPKKFKNILGYTQLFPQENKKKIYEQQVQQLKDCLKRQEDTFCFQCLRLELYNLSEVVRYMLKSAVEYELLEIRLVKMSVTISDQEWTAIVSDRSPHLFLNRYTNIDDRWYLRTANTLFMLVSDINAIWSVDHKSIKDTLFKKYNIPDRVRALTELLSRLPTPSQPVKLPPLLPMPSQPVVGKVINTDVKGTWVRKESSSDQEDSDSDSDRDSVIPTESVDMWYTDINMEEYVDLCPIGATERQNFFRATSKKLVKLGKSRKTRWLHFNPPFSTQDKFFEHLAKLIPDMVDGWFEGILCICNGKIDIPDIIQPFIYDDNVELCTMSFTNPKGVSRQKLVYVFVIYL